MVINDSGVVGIFLNGFSSSLAEAIKGNGKMMHVTKQSFEDFKSRVLDKNVEWTNATIMPDNVNVNIPGTWQSDEDIVRSYEGGKPKHNRRTTHRKPTKRRRSRRVYRKPKKN